MDTDELIDCILISTVKAVQSYIESNLATVQREIKVEDRLLTDQHVTKEDHLKRIQFLAGQVHELSKFKVFVQQIENKTVGAKQ